VVVTLPEEMPTSETEELVGSLRRELQMPVAALVVNQTLPPLFEQRTDVARRGALALDEVPAFAPIGQAMRTRAIREEIQREMMTRLQSLHAPMVTLPALPVDRVRRAHMQQLSKILSDAGI
jgi:anion-transporting  ArsA/GET3 family ATPase